MRAPRRLNHAPLEHQLKVTLTKQQRTIFLGQVELGDHQTITGAVREAVVQGLLSQGISLRDQGMLPQ